MVHLVPMTEAEYEKYFEFAIPNYASEHVKAGRWSEKEALQRAKQEYDELLPDGLNTSNQHFFSIVDEQTTTKVGMLWFAIRSRKEEPAAYVYDVIVYEAYRRQGYGEQTFRAMEAKVRELGSKTLSLHVFGHNHAARAFYEKLGFVTTNVMMTKTLEMSADSS